MARGSTALEGHSWHQERQSCTQEVSKSGRGQEAEGRQEAGGRRGQGNHHSPRPPLLPTGTASPPAPPRHAPSAWAASPPQLTHEDGAVVGVGRRVQPLTSREPVSWGEGRRQEAGGGRGQGNHLSPRPPLHPTGTASPPAPPRHASSAWAASPPQLRHTRTRRWWELGDECSRSPRGSQ